MRERGVCELNKRGGVVTGASAALHEADTANDELKSRLAVSSQPSVSSVVTQAHASNRGHAQLVPQT